MAPAAGFFELEEQQAVASGPAGVVNIALKLPLPDSMGHNPRT